MIALPVSGSRPTVYRPSQRPSFRLRMFPSPFARLFGMVAAPFATNNTVTKGTKLPESRTVIRKLSFALRPRHLIFAYCGAVFALPEGTLLWLQRCDFRTVESLFSLTAVTQNMHDLRRCPCEASTTFFVHIILRNGYKAPPKFLGRLRLGELRRQPLQNVPQKAPQLTALKPPSTARTAGRSDWAERRFRRQPFILLSFSSSKKP